jgi:hypothetical protein
MDMMEMRLSDRQHELVERLSELETSIGSQGRIHSSRGALGEDGVGESYKSYKSRGRHCPGIVHTDLNDEFSDHTMASFNKTQDP